MDMHDHHKGHPAAMAELFGRMPHGDAGFFVARRLDMRGRKVEGGGPAIQSHIHCFFYVTQGEALINIGEELCLFKAGECASIPAGRLFSVRYFDNCAGFMGGFGTDYIIDNGVNPMQAYGALRRWGAHKVMFDPKVQPHIEGIFERLCSEQESGGSQKIIKACLALLLTEIEEASAMPDDLSTENRHCNEFIESVFEKCNLRTPVAEYASRLGISQGYLQKVLKRFTGKSPVAWIHEAVVLEAKALLLNTDMAVADISARLGVEDPAYFSRLFKRYTGTTPVQYRREKAKSNESPR